MSSQLVLLLGGRLTAGKDEVADHLTRNHDFVKLGMSDTLAEALYRLNPFIPLHAAELRGTELVEIEGPDSYYEYQRIVDMVGYVQAKTNPEVRRLLQVLGTEVGRQLLDENIWVTAAKNRIQEQLDAGKNVVLTGIRFPNELMLEWHTWTNANAVSVWIDRPSLGTPDGNASQHSSEGSLSASDFEYVLDNDKDLQALYGASEALLEVIRNDYT